QQDSKHGAKPKRFSEAFTIRDSGGVSVLSAGRKRERGDSTYPVRKKEGKWGRFFSRAVSLALLAIQQQPQFRRATREPCCRFRERQPARNASEKTRRSPALKFGSK